MTTGPFFHLSIAMVCVNCESVFALRPTCPGCGSEEIYPIDKFLSLRDGMVFTTAAVAELVRLRALKSA